LKAKVIQAVEDAMVDAVMDSAAGLGLTPLQRAKFIVAISETLIDAVTPYVQKEGAEAAAPRVRAPRKPKAKPAGLAPNGQQTLPEIPPAPKAPDTTQPAPFKGPPAAAQPFAG
jgi:hypothetical protein